MAVPSLTAVTVPEAETVATVLSEDAHSRATVPDCFGSIIGVSVAESAASSSREDGLMMMLSINKVSDGGFSGVPVPVLSLSQDARIKATAVTVHEMNSFFINLVGVNNSITKEMKIYDNWNKR